MTAALKATLGKQEQEPRTRFHEQFLKEADEYDRDFHKKYHDDLNTALIFVSWLRVVYFPLPKRNQGRSFLRRGVGIYRRDPIADAT